MRILAVLAVALLSACTPESEVPETSGAAAPDELPPLRRVVTTENDAGKSVVLADGQTKNTLTLNGSLIQRLWEAPPAPVPIPVGVDLGATAGDAYREGYTGASLYTADIPAGSDLTDIPLHRMDTLDYIVILAGTLDMVLDDGVTVPLTQGDVLVQNGANHSFVNPYDAPARLLAVTITGERQPLPEAD